jgi:hypothetical protein
MSAKPAFAMLSIFVALTFLAAACGGSDGGGDAEVASLTEESAADEEATPEITDEELGEIWGEAVLEFSGCVREAGITDFPDLDAARITSNDAFFAELQATGINVTDATVTDAMTGCGDVLGEVVQLVDGPSADELAALEEAALAIMQCIRDNGYPDVPDLDLSGGFDANILLQLIPFVDVTDTEFQNVAGQCVADSPVDFDGRDSISGLLQSG